MQPLPHLSSSSRSPRWALLAVILLLCSSAPAFADATLFIGSTTTPANRAAKGVAIGFGILVIGFEFEYSSTNEDLEEGAPSLRTGMGNILFQTPIPIAGAQFYFTTGVGGYRERLGEGAAERQETHLGMNTGGGAKISLIGPLRARLDYRFFKLQGDPLHSNVHRIYAGANLAF